MGVWVGAGMDRWVLCLILGMTVGEWISKFKVVQIEEVERSSLNGPAL